MLLVSALFFVPTIALAKIQYFQIPAGFQFDKYPLKKLIKWQDLTLEPERVQLEKICKKNGINCDLLRSDFDGDGIRDFTLSTGKGKVILAAEDDDWDGDGIPNLIDDSVGKSSIDIVNKPVEIVDSYPLGKAIFPNAKSYIEGNKVGLLTSKGASFESLVLEVFALLLTHARIEVRFLHATKPVVQYGDHSFFSYIPNTRSIEVYSDELRQYIESEAKARFQGADKKQLTMKLVLPILVHSLAHELGHAKFGSKFHQPARENGWRWDRESVRSLYLKAYRHPEKEMSSFYKNFSYKGLTKKALFKEKREYEKCVSSFIKGSKESCKKSWKTGSKSKQKHLKYSLLKAHNLPSYYAVTKPQEWLAEVFSACLFGKILPGQKALDVATTTEILINFRADVVSERLCKSLL